jgi:hypothetical protein
MIPDARCAQTKSNLMADTFSGDVRFSVGLRTLTRQLLAQSLGFSI